MNQRPMRNLSGDSLIEILISITLMAILATGLFSLLASQFIKQGQSSDTITALSLAEEGLMAARSIRDTSWDAAISGNHGVVLQNGGWLFQGVEDVTDQVFHRTVSVAEVSPTQKNVTSTVTWMVRGARERKVELASVLTDWRNAYPTPVWGDWRYPVVAGSVDLGAGNAGMSVAVQQKLIYAGAMASDSKKSDFYTVNAQDSFHPYILGSLNTGGGLVDVAASGTWAFAISPNDTNKFQVINVSNPSSPTLAAQLAFSNMLTNPDCVALKSGYAYIGGKKDDKGELGVVDVRNPASPVVVGSLMLSVDVNGIAIKGNRAYLATSKDDAEIVIVDIADPTKPVYVGKYDVVGTGDANGVYIDAGRNRLYVARNAEGATTNPEMAVLDIANQDAPVLMSQMNSNSGFLRVVAGGDLSFVSALDANKEFQVFNFHDLDAPFFFSSVNYPQDAMDLFLEDNLIYVAVRSNDAIKILTAN